MFSQSLLCDMEWKSIASKTKTKTKQQQTTNKNTTKPNSSKHPHMILIQPDSMELFTSLFCLDLEQKKKKKKQHNWIFHHFTTSEKNEMLKKARTIVTLLHLKLCINLQEGTYVKFPLERVIKASTLLTLKFLCTYSRISLLSIMYLCFT